MQNKDEIKDIYLYSTTLWSLLTFIHSYFNSFHYYYRCMYCICKNLYTCITKCWFYVHVCLRHNLSKKFKVFSIGFLRIFLFLFSNFFFFALTNVKLSRSIWYAGRIHHQGEERDLNEREGSAKGLYSTTAL